MQTQIRAMAPEDRDDVLALADRLTSGVAPWRDPGRVRTAVREWVRSSTGSVDVDHPVWVATVDGRLVGFVSACESRHWTGEVDAYIGELVVRADREGRGVGTALVRTVECWASERGLARVRLSTGAANGQALGLYARLGFQHEDVTLTRVLDSTRT